MNISPTAAPPPVPRCPRSVCTAAAARAAGHRVNARNIRPRPPPVKLFTAFFPHFRCRPPATGRPDPNEPHRPPAPYPPPAPYRPPAPHQKCPPTRPAVSRPQKRRARPLPKHGVKHNPAQRQKLIFSPASPFQPVRPPSRRITSAKSEASPLLLSKPRPYSA